MKNNKRIEKIRLCREHVAANKFLTTYKNLDKNNFNPYLASSQKDALNYIKNMIQYGGNVFVAGSMTVFEIGLFDVLSNNKNINFLNVYKEGLSLQERTKIRENALSCDYFITSSNAVTINGEIINIDGTCNRAAGMLFGPKKVIIIVGRNKISMNIETAIDRIKNYSAPQNATRLDYKTPCTKTGRCENCSHEDRICNALVIQYKEKVKNRTHVILLNEDLGF